MSSISNEQSYTGADVGNRWLIVNYQHSNSQNLDQSEDWTDKLLLISGVYFNKMATVDQMIYRTISIGKLKAMNRSFKITML